MERVHNTRRNRIVFWSFTVIGIVLTGTIAYLMFLAFEDRPLRPAALALGLAAFWAWWIGSTVAQHRELRTIERELRDNSVQVPDEEPIPIRLAESRESLVVSLVMLLLIAAAFVAYFAGWIG